MGRGNGNSKLSALNYELRVELMIVILKISPYDNFLPCPALLSFDLLFHVPGNLLMEVELQYSSTGTTAPHLKNTSVSLQP